MMCQLGHALMTLCLGIWLLLGAQGSPQSVPDELMGAIHDTCLVCIAVFVTYLIDLHCPEWACGALVPMVMPWLCLQSLPALVRGSAVRHPKRVWGILAVCPTRWSAKGWPPVACFIACTVSFLYFGVVASVCTSALWVAQCPNLPPQPMLFPQPWC